MCTDTIRGSKMLKNITWLKESYKPILKHRHPTLAQTQSLQRRWHFNTLVARKRDERCSLARRAMIIFRDSLRTNECTNSLIIEKRVHSELRDCHSRMRDHASALHVRCVIIRAVVIHTSAQAEVTNLHQNQTKDLDPTRYSWKAIQIKLTCEYLTALTMYHASDD